MAGKFQFYFGLPSFNPVAIRNGLSECNTSDYAIFVQRLNILVQTSMTFGQLWVDAVPTSRVHWEVMLQGSRVAF